MVSWLEELDRRETAARKEITELRSQRAAPSERPPHLHRVLRGEADESLVAAQCGGESEEVR